MKRVLTLLMVAAITAGISAQELDSLKAIMENKTAPEKSATQENQPSYPIYVEDKGDEVKVQVFDKELLKVVDKGDSTYVKIGDKKFLEVSDQPDSTRIRVGDKEISIVERDDEPQVSIHNIGDEDEISGNPRFRGHWAGFEWGINNFMDEEFTLSREGADQFMDLNTGRSWAINLNFAQFSLGLGTSHAGFLTGLGLEFNNYFFDRDNSIMEVNDYVVDTTFSGNISKSKLATTFIRVPLIFEVQFPHTIRSKRVFLSGGLIAGLKIGSHTKVTYKDDGGRSRDRNRDDFNISPFRYGVTARLGYGSMNVFGDYYFTPMFVADKGPALHPFTLGLSFTF